MIKITDLRNCSSWVRTSAITAILIPPRVLLGSGPDDTCKIVAPPVVIQVTEVEATRVLDLVQTDIETELVN